MPLKLTLFFDRLHQGAIIQESSREQERINLHPPALGEILIMKAKGNY